ncbi:uncharacterized protein EDB93DRAFT_1103445 [Suillus bovinus]|uniref:uncharacterized protein n=1 Tax=Suillus bovinus TaxID=48563 RepID=UPI001B88616B|nr:uncharacterized protein EDB93DRAFT_1103445 [Suillus bovinus]KAG2150746.1 hypothetical protein EDB93DRAFT_1103445 [Suillus bovinus]
MTSILLLSRENKSKGVNTHLVGIDATGQDIGRTGAMRGNVGSGSDMCQTVGKCVGSGSDCRTWVRVVGTARHNFVVNFNDIIHLLSNAKATSHKKVVDNVLIQKKKENTKQR